MSKGDAMGEINLLDVQDIPAAPVLPGFDPEEYRTDLADLGLTEAQEIELLEILWPMMGWFARTGFEVDVCGLIFDEFNEASAPESGNGSLIVSPTMETPLKDRGNGEDI